MMLIALLVQRTDMEAVGNALVRIGAAWTGVLAGIMLVFAGFSAVRWYRVLVQLDESVPFCGILGDTLAGMTYNMLLPTTIGGDIIRALRCSGRLSNKHRAWSSVLYERVAGLLALALVGAIAIAVAPAPQLGPLRWLAIATSLLLAVLFVQLSAPFRLMLLILGRRMLGSPEFFQGMTRDFDGPLARIGPRAEVLAWSILCVALGYAYSVASALSLGAPEAIIPLVLGLPIIFIGSMLPVTISGLGLREGLFVVVLGQLGVDSAVALAIAIQTLAGLLLLAVVGLLVLLGQRLTTGSSGMAPQR